eukprot:m.70959 g.70959  ORF g.70959 m.70959 type:complete len:409 (-) comp10044_c0_seq1:221-1447(-)
MGRELGPTTSFHVLIRSTTPNVDFFGGGGIRVRCSMDFEQKLRPQPKFVPPDHHVRSDTALAAVNQPWRRDFPLNNIGSGLKSAVSHCFSHRPLRLQTPHPERSVHRAQLQKENLIVQGVCIQFRNGQVGDRALWNRCLAIRSGDRSKVQRELDLVINAVEVITRVERPVCSAIGSLRTGTGRGPASEAGSSLLVPHCKDSPLSWRARRPPKLLQLLPNKGHGVDVVGKAGWRGQNSSGRGSSGGLDPGGTTATGATVGHFARVTRPDISIEPPTPHVGMQHKPMGQRGPINNPLYGAVSDHGVWICWADSAKEFCSLLASQRPSCDYQPTSQGGGHVLCNVARTRQWCSTVWSLRARCSMSGSVLTINLSVEAEPHSHVLKNFADLKSLAGQAKQDLGLSTGRSALC